MSTSLPTGSDLSGNPEWRKTAPKCFELGARVHDLWQQQEPTTRVPLQMGDYERFSRYAAAAARLSLSKETLYSLESQSDEIVVLTNAPIDEDLPPTPVDGRRPSDKLTYTTEASLVGTAEAAGMKFFAYQEEKAGAPVQEIAPVRGQEHVLGNSGRADLGWHTDAAALEPWMRPDALLLLGLRNENRTPTRLAPVNDALRLMNEAHKLALSEPRFIVPLPASFEVKMALPKRPVALIRREHEAFEIAANLHSVEPLDEAAAAAVAALVAALDEVAISVVIGPGTLVLFNNRRILHARDAVRGDRWLQRVYARRSLAMLRHATGCDRVFPITRILEARARREADN